jgi:hypothetical protein
MSAFLIILLVFLSIVVDIGTTAVGASDQFGPAGVAISLVLQLGQLASLVMLRAEEARERPLLRWSLLSIAAVITAINALFNYYALHGIPEGPSDPLYVLRTLTPEDPNWTWNIALLLLSFVITTEADAVISTLVHTRGHLALMSASIPIYLSPFQAALGLAEGLSGEEGEGTRERFDFMALAVPVLALFLIGMRGLDAYSTFVQTLEVVPRGGTIQSLVAAYAALMAITYQARILLLARSRIRVGLLEWGRMAAVTGLNIYCSITFFSRWSEAALLAIVLGVMTSTLAEVSGSRGHLCAGAALHRSPPGRRVALDGGAARRRGRPDRPCRPLGLRRPRRGGGRAAPDRLAPAGPIPGRPIRGGGDHLQEVLPARGGLSRRRFFERSNGDVAFCQRRGQQAGARRGLLERSDGDGAGSRQRGGE